MATKKSNVVIHLRPNGKGEVLIDGEDWSGRISHVFVSGGVDKATRVQLELTDCDVEIMSPGAYVDATSIIDPDRVMKAVRYP